MCETAGKTNAVRWMSRKNLWRVSRPRVLAEGHCLIVNVVLPLPGLDGGNQVLSFSAEFRLSSRGRNKTHVRQQIPSAAAEVSAQRLI